MAVSESFAAHIDLGITTLARAWAVTRRDGLVLGFTDHDLDLSFDGITFKADTGLSARAVSQSTGLSIDNTEALGALSDAAMSEADIRAGRYDGAKVEAWLVNWADPSMRLLQFRGYLGEVTRVAGAFRAELVGLSEALNQPQGRVYQKPCSAVLGDGRCGVDTLDPAFSAQAVVVSVDGANLSVSGAVAYAARWFERGRLEVTSGAASGLVGAIKNDRLAGDLREIELWDSLRSDLAVGDALRLVAGCDKRPGTCHVKFDNIVNFQGFPHIPGEDRLTSIPVNGGVSTGSTK
ncbi:MAG: DUF2163 domain-containing protein [Maritimibacter sp.]